LQKVNEYRFLAAIYLEVTSLITVILKYLYYRNQGETWSYLSKSILK